jgi:CHAT domain-containing protein
MPGICGFRANGLCSVITAVAVFFSGELFAAEPAQAVLIRFDGQLQPSIRRVEEGQVRLESGELGLIVWTSEQGERRTVFRGTWSRPIQAVPTDAAPQPALAEIRGFAGAATAEAAQLTMQVDPLLLPGVMKALQDLEPAGFFTPANGSVILERRPIFRRIVDAGPAPAAVATLSGGELQASVVFAAGETSVPFERIDALPPAWREGLPAGAYTLQFEETTLPTSTFTVETDARWKQVNQWLDQWRELTGGDSDPFFALVATEYLAGQQPHPYLVDAWELLNGVPHQEFAYLQWRLTTIGAMLRGESRPVRETEAATRIQGIDDARDLITQGRLTEALTRLQSVADSGDPRARALADLYRGVVHAESGLGQEEAADFFFRRAVAALGGANAEDEFRATNNYANFLLDRAQDRSLDHAFRMAAGVHSLFADALLYWDDARRYYEAAEQLAGQLNEDDQAVSRVNQARLYAILADIVATLDVSDGDQRQLASAEEAVRAISAKHLRQASRLLASGDPYVRGVANAIEAHLAFRRGDFARCREHAMKAHDSYVAAGSITGIESLQRLLGLTELRSAGDAPAAISDHAARVAALGHFRISHLLAEFLRDQVPADRIGRSLAGFFARRSYVYGQLVELSIAESEPLMALRYAELAKARALQDLLAARGTVSPRTSDPSATLDEVLSSWPEDQLALEYFLTTQRAWVFGISAGGKVQAFALVDQSQQPIAARELVGRIRMTLRSELDRYPLKLRQRVLQGQGFDPRWQDKLHDLYLALIPAPLASQLGDSRKLLVIPHHILHYFPFAALVTERDTAPRDALEMVKPRFLIDTPVDICYAPSLSTWHMLRRGPNRPIEQGFAVGISQLPGAPPLPGTQAEIAALQESLGSRLKVVLRDRQADKVATLKLMRQPGLLLVGTHGQNYPESPLASALMLYPRGRDNGRLTAGELYFWDVQSDLIVLSACYSGLAERSPLPGDDLFGLQRALLQAGARTVITGQWDVYDATGPSLLRDFFDRLSRGDPAPAALAEAQRRFLKQLRDSTAAEPWLHPYFWSVYTVAGDDRTTCNTESELLQAQVLQNPRGESP